jgi:5-methylcytosine-specific restriction enzyme subunit McrC
MSKHQIHITSEYGGKKSLASFEERKRLEAFLEDVWEKRAFPFAKEWVTDDDAEVNRVNKKQPFLQFDGMEFRANNFVGFIQTADVRIDIYPKVFKGQLDNTKGMVKHLFYWLSYCRRVRFPFLQSDLDVDHIDSLPELLIYLISYEIREHVRDSPISIYEQKEESMTTPRGSIDFKNYIKNGLSSGNWQNVDCIYEPFVYDNRVNQVIKYVCRLLQGATRLSENKEILDDIVFVLDEVEDRVCTASDVDSVKLSPLFSAYSDILRWCRMILEQQIYSGEHYDSMQWCLLLPMEYVFEDFITGFIERHFSDKWEIHPQAQNMSLSNEPKAFMMKHDILLESRDEQKRQIILDTKYKRRTSEDFKDAKKGISQADMYQMVSYGLRRGCSDLYLLYPNTTETCRVDVDRFKVESGFSENLPLSININALELPFWSLSEFEKLEHTLQLKINLLKF